MDNSFENPFFLREDQVLGRAQLSIATHRHQKETNELKKKIEKLNVDLKRKTLNINNENKDLKQILYDLKLQKQGKKDCLFPAIHSHKSEVVEAMRSFSFLENIKSVRRSTNPALPSRHKFVLNMKNPFGEEHMDRRLKILREKAERQKKSSLQPIDSEAVSEALGAIRAHRSYQGNGNLTPKTAEKQLYNLLNRQRNLNATDGVQNMDAVLETILVIQSGSSYKLGENTRW